MKSVLSDKVLCKSLVVVDSVKFDDYKTKLFVEMLDALKLTKKTLFVFGESDKKVIKSASNLIGIKTSNVVELNVYDILNHNSLVLDLKALDRIEEVYA